MGLLMDIRSGKKDGHGVYAIIFWFLAGLIGGSGIGAYAAGGWDKAVLIFGSVGAMIGLCAGLYAAFGDARLAKVLALPGYLMMILALVLGVG